MKLLEVIAGGQAWAGWSMVDGVGGWFVAVLAGVVAGLGVAVPVGAVGVLVVQEALSRGRVNGLAAAGGVAVTDLLYACVAVLAGAAVAGWIGPHTAQVRLVAAAVLAVVAGWGLRGVWRLRRTTGAIGGTPADDGVGKDVGEDDRNGVGRAGHRGPVGVGFRFAAVTVVNPATVVYFVLVVTGLSGALGSGADRAGFAVSVFLGSLCLACAAGRRRCSGGPSPVPGGADGDRAGRSRTGLAAGCRPRAAPLTAATGQRALLR